MAQRPFESGAGLGGAGQSPLSHIHKDMEVYDLDGERIGTVDQVYMGESSPRAHDLGRGAQSISTTDPTPDSIVEVVARAFDDDRLPQVFRERLLMNGFIRINADGLFAADRYAMPDQIASVSGDRVTLKVHRKDLIKD